MNGSKPVVVEGYYGSYDDLTPGPPNDKIEADRIPAKRILKHFGLDPQHGFAVNTAKKKHEEGRTYGGNMQRILAEVQSSNDTMEKILTDQVYLDAKDKARVYQDSEIESIIIKWHEKHNPWMEKR